MTADVVLVIAPPGTIVHATSTRGPCTALVFPSMDSLNLWCARGVEPRAGLRPCVETALRQIGASPERLPERIAATLEFIARADRVPILKQLLDVWPSRRTFFRVWAAEMPEGPSRFLQRVRAAHALQLGAAANDFAAGIAAAGFPGVKAFRSTMEELQLPLPA